MFKFLLFPFAVLYDLVTRTRNLLYDRGMKPSVGFENPVISVGNLAVGGTGKTPMIEYLVRLLKDHYRVAIVSRGYGRDTKGFRIATPMDSADTIGDEPLQYFRKFNRDITVAVGEDRAWAIPLVLQEDDSIDLVLLDDAFQHRRVRPSLSILLSDFSRPFYSDWMLPMGRLREAASGAERADCIVITKCPESIEENLLIDIEAKVRDITPKPVFFTTISYSTPISFGSGNFPLRQKVVLVTGIARPAPVVDYVRKHFTLVRHLDYADHYHYGQKDFQRFRKLAEDHPDITFLTTEKDMVKLNVPGAEVLLSTTSFYYLPITVRFLKNEEHFCELVLDSIRKKSLKTGS
jgi:tetraacyldisaccharide 4'-kinase